MGKEIKDLLSVREVAKILHVSRNAVSKKIKSGKIKAIKVGRNFVIKKDDLAEAVGNIIGDEKKKDIDKAILKAVREYKETFKRLGRE